MWKFSNPWKVAFIVLLVVVVAMIIAVIWGITRTNPSSADMEDVGVEEAIDEESVFQVSVTKKQLNALLKEYMGETAINAYVEEQLVISSSFEVWGLVAPVTILLEPIVLENGNVFLVVEHMEVGMIQLPSDKVLQMIDAGGLLPVCASIDETGTGILVDVSKITNEAGMRFKVKEIELAEDSMVVDVYM